MSGAYCTDCKVVTELVFDHSAGDTVCSECGLVLESHSIDGTPEWRTFADDSSNTDPNRLGEQTNPLLANRQLFTVIVNPKGSSSGDFSFGNCQNRNPNPDRSLIQAFKSIATFSDRLGLVATIKDRASEIYKRLEDKKKSGKPQSKDAVMVACLYIACRQEGKPRTIKEIYSAANGLKMKKFNQAKDFIDRTLGLEETGQCMELGAIDFIRRFCSNLGMSKQAVKAAREAVQKSDEFDIRRTPISIAAVVIYIVTQLSGDKKALKDISMATGVAERTIISSYKDVCPHLTKLVPSWFANEEDIRNLSSPCLIL